MNGDLIITDSPDLKINEFNLAKRVAEHLHNHYPGFLWAVDVGGGLVNIRCMNLSGSMGYTLHEKAIYSASEFEKNVMRAGGEILERYRQARSQINENNITDLATDSAGRHKWAA